MSSFTFDGKQIFYYEIGEGRPLLLLHGNTASSAMFGGVAEKYAAKHKVVLIDFLGHGRSDRLAEFPADLWYYGATQVVAFLREKEYSSVDLIGSSGGALVAINAALEAPELISKLIADSFEGETPLEAFTANVVSDRERSKRDENAAGFYKLMHGEDWQAVVDNDTLAISRHAREIGRFFHKDLSALKADILLTGSSQDEFISAAEPEFFERVYGEMLRKAGHGSMHLFETGGHPAMLSNAEEFYELSERFLGES